MSEQKIVEVAAAVLINTQGFFLLAQRPKDKVYAGYWEFPGGKIEVGETPYQALCRELQEELGIQVLNAHSWLLQEFTYPHATVRLHFFRVFLWQGEPAGLEGQQLSWQQLPELTVTPILPANEPIFRALSLPNIYAISNAQALGSEAFLKRLVVALQNGLRLIQVREKKMSSDAYLDLTHQVVHIAHAYQAKVLVNDDVNLARQTGADGVHYSSESLMQATIKPHNLLCGASCHNAAELSQAGRLGFDFALLSPILPTQSHPDTPHIGWEHFSALTADAKLPVYALGGLEAGDLALAQRYGAHGISLLSQAW